MQACRGSRDRALFRREHGLVVGRILLVGCAFRGDIGWQWWLAEIGNRLIEHRAMKRERQRDLAVDALGFDLGIEMAEQAYLALIAEAHLVARRQFFGRLDQRLPARAVEPFDQRRLDLGFGLTADAAARELRRYHLGVVDDELVSGLEPLRQIADNLITQHALALHHQHPRGIARTCRAQRDRGLRQFEVEEIGAHWLVELVSRNCEAAPSPLPSKSDISDFDKLCCRTRVNPSWVGEVGDRALARAPGEGVRTTRAQRTLTRSLRSRPLPDGER